MRDFRSSWTSAYNYYYHYYNKNTCTYRLCMERLLTVCTYCMCYWDTLALILVVLYESGHSTYYMCFCYEYMKRPLSIWLVGWPGVFFIVISTPFLAPLHTCMHPPPNGRMQQSNQLEIFFFFFFTLKPFFVQSTCIIYVTVRTPENVSCITS